MLVLDPSLSTSPLAPSRDPMQALHLGWRRVYAGSEGALSLWLRGIGPGRPELPHPAEELLVGTGQPLFGPPPPALAALISGEKFAGIWNYRWAVAGPDEAGLAGNHLAGLQVDRSFGGLTPAVLWYSDAARSRWRAEDRPTTALWVAAAGLELEDRSGTAAPLSPPVVSGKIKGKEHFDVLADLARRAAHQHNLNLLRKLVEAGDRNTTIRAGWDPARLLPWIEVEHQNGNELWLQRAWILQGDGREVRLSNGADEGAIRAALGWMSADLRLEPQP